MKLKWYKINRVLHRDLGYFFFAMTIIYAVSGIALNHVNDWNPQFIITRTEISYHPDSLNNKMSKEETLKLLEKYEVSGLYKKHYYPEPGKLKIFLKGGSAEIDLASGEGFIEDIRRRPFFFEISYLHYNPNLLWTWISDIYSAALFILAVTGLFILKGKKGIKGRGAWMSGLGLLMIIIFLIIYAW